MCGLLTNEYISRPEQGVCQIIEVISAGILLVLNLFYDLPSSLILSVLTMGIFPAIFLYRQIKRALPTIHLLSRGSIEK
jgi:hypothetical protein